MRGGPWPPELDQISPENHPVVSLIDHVSNDGATIALPYGMNVQKRSAALHYGAHASTTKEVALIHAEVTNQF